MIDNAHANQPMFAILMPSLQTADHQWSRHLYNTFFNILPLHKALFIFRRLSKSYSKCFFVLPA